MSEYMDNPVPITPQQYDFLADIQQKILKKLVSEQSIELVLSALCSLAESVLDNAVASIMMVDTNTGLMSVLSAPSIPIEGHQALANLKPGPYGGSCGNAVFYNEAQFIQNTFDDKRWANLRHIAHDFNLCSCWSTPIRDENKQAIGSFALSSFEHRKPLQFHKKLLETCSAIVSIVLAKQKKEKRINLLSIAMDNASEGVVISDSENKIVEVNPAYENIYGFSEKDILGQNQGILSSTFQGKVFYQQLWQKLLKKGQWQGEITNLDSSGKRITQWMSITVIRNSKGEVQNYLSIFSDLTDLRTAQKQIADMAFYDATTHLYNKTYLEQEIANNDKNYTLLLLNINNFSYLNAAYGFDVGDKILKEIAVTLVKLYSKEKVFRLNSDEFALIFDEYTDIALDIKSIQQYFYDTLIEVGDISLYIAFTYGATCGNTNLLRNCSLALKQAKRLGKNRYHIFDAEYEQPDNSAINNFISSNKLIHNALKLEQLIPYFQGIHHNNNKKIQKFEVLARIIKDDEVISPYHFLDAAKLSGLLPEITRVIIDKSFKIMANYEYSFSLNITEEDLSQNYLIEYLTSKSLQYEIAPQRVILEILEGISAVGKKNHITQLNQLKAKGYALAIDDFGTEYSNFERILDLDIDFLKIDAKYIKDIDENKKSYEISRAIAFFAHNAGIPCIAEFVHSASVQTVVEKLGINYSQGYYFSEPAPLPLIT